MAIEVEEKIVYWMPSLLVNVTEYNNYLFIYFYNWTII